jgi:DsbC/DsbD-like thiol-disulfide interchange protein
MPSDRIRWTRKFLSVGLCALALIAALGENAALVASKGSSTVVKATASASKIDAAGKQTLTVSLALAPGWHIYANPVNNKEFTSVQTVVTVHSGAKPAAVKIQYPAGTEHTDSGTTYSVYESKVNIQAVVTRAPGDTSPLDVEVRFNACHGARKICLPPGSEKFTLP